ncbi:MAG: DUF1624 domain-containing protein [Bdellovibrionales bacterium]|nr:DUF1624 domain-containing protein [Bdellovibrionales bacterium]
MKNSQSLKRYRFFDSYRGFALVLMAVYHFSFDLNEFGILQKQMNHDPFWLGFRAIIMTSFLGLVGVSFYLGNTNYQSLSFKPRLLKIASCALLISVTSYFLNPSTWIYFGVLHFIFFASLIAPLLVRYPRIALWLGVVLTGIPFFFRSMLFNRPGLVLTGLSPIRPDTEDFSPFLPWLGVVAIGVFVGYWVSKNKPGWAHKEIPALSKLGQNSLLFYMTHQLILYPVAWLISRLV